MFWIHKLHLDGNIHSDNWEIAKIIAVTNGRIKLIKHYSAEILVIYFTLFLLIHGAGIYVLYEVVNKFANQKAYSKNDEKYFIKDKDSICI